MNLVYARSDASPVSHGADGDDVDMEGGAVLCKAPFDCTLEGMEISLGESEDIFRLCKLDGGGEEHGEAAFELGEDCAWLGIGVVVEIGEVAGEEAVYKWLELVWIKVWGCCGHEGEGEDEVAEDVGEKGEICGWVCRAEWVAKGSERRCIVDLEEFSAELKGYERLFEVVSLEGVHEQDSNRLRSAI